MEAGPKFNPLPKVLELEFAEGTEVLLLPQRNSSGAVQKPKKKKRLRKGNRVRNLSYYQ